MNQLHKILIQWTNQKELAIKSLKNILKTMEDMLKVLNQIESDKFSNDEIELLIISLEIIEKYSKSEQCLKIFTELKEIILNLSLRNHFIYLRPLRIKQKNQINSNIASKIMKTFEQHKLKKPKSMVVKTYAPRFYEEGTER